MDGIKKNFNLNNIKNSYNNLNKEENLSLNGKKH